MRATLKTTPTYIAIGIFTKIRHSNNQLNHFFKLCKKSKHKMHYHKIMKEEIFGKFGKWHSLPKSSLLILEKTI